MIYTNFVVLQTLMLHTKFQGNWPSGCGEEDFLRFWAFLAWRPSWSCDLDHLYKLLFPLPKEAPHKIWLWLAKRFQSRRCLKMVEDDNNDGRRSMGILSSHLWAEGWADLRLRWAKNKQLSSQLQRTDRWKSYRYLPSKKGSAQRGV